MKKIIITTLTVLLMGLCNIMPYAAAESPVVSVSGAIARPGETVEVMVNLEDCAGFNSLALEIGYDSNVFELVEEPTDNVGSGIRFSHSPSKKYNPYMIKWNGTGDCTFNGTLVTLSFKVNETAVCGNYSITVDYYKGPKSGKPYQDGINCNFNANKQPLKLQYQNGSITVTDQNIISASNISFGSTKTEFSVNAVALSEFGGKLIAAFKDEKGVLRAVRMCDAQPTTTMTYNGACDYADVLWWDVELMTPISNLITINK